MNGIVIGSEFCIECFLKESARPRLQRRHAHTTRQHGHDWPGR